MRFLCPHCQASTLGLQAKLGAALWGIVRCPDCQKRCCAQPLVLGALYFLLVWDILLFGYVSFVNYKTHDPITSAVYLSVMVAGVAILGFFAAYVPLVAMRSDTD
ncbi:MAG: hypothetical protein OEW08_07225 [Gammaproteobacteria bacterium]|nr:hypothetical protein [Gammaproteobacteria bacterium]